MKTIWKCTLEPRTEVRMPIGAIILGVQTQRGEPQLWALVDPSQEEELRRFSCYGTGWSVPDNPGKYIGTFQTDGGTFVFHVFEDIGD